MFFYSATFPFFNNVDEAAHYDMVIKYSHFEIPDTIVTISEESASFYALYGTWEYAIKDGYRFFPLHPEKLDSVQLTIYLATVQRVSNIINHEYSQAPLYYFIAGMWTNVGKLIGVKGLSLLYWIRFLNILLVIALVYISYLIAINLFPDKSFIFYGFPLLVAAVPQDIFYSIQNDVLSSLSFALTFLMVIRFLNANLVSKHLSLLTGLCMASTVLVKSNNIPLLLVFSVFLIPEFFQKRKAEKSSSEKSAFIYLFLGCTVPIVLWMFWNLSSYGDLTGSVGKFQLLGWKSKPITQWFDHPFFSWKGLSFFWQELITTFWRGELIWNGLRVKMTAVDVFYWTSSPLLLLTALIFAQRKCNLIQKKINLFAASCFISLVFFLILLSLNFDFGACSYPSTDSPYFTSGRLISATLLPFFLLYIQGFYFFLSWIRSERLKFMLLILLVMAISLSELLVTQSVIESHFNWFHI